jgi:hypothetical protein
VVGGGDPAWFKALETELTALLDGSKFELAWPASKNTLVVHTDRVSDELLAAVKATAEAAMPEGATLVQYNHNMEISWRDINKYAACVTRNDMFAVNANYQNDVTSEGEWIYPLNSLNAGFVFKSTAVNIKRLVYYAPSLNGLYHSNFNALPNVQEIVINCPAYVGYAVTGAYGRAWNEFVVNCPNLEKITVLALSDDFDNLDRFFYNNPKLKEIELPKLPKLKNAPEFCLQSQLSKRSVLHFIKEVIINVATGFRNLGLGIHVDHQNDEEVLAAIANAESKGWTLTVRWNGTPTSTASTMAMGSLIYAKVGEHELPDGTIEQYLDWGHYVTDETGYETFRSLASAYLYFGLTMPEEESQPTE